MRLVEGSGMRLVEGSGMRLVEVVWIETVISTHCLIAAALTSVIPLSSPAS